MAYEIKCYDNDPFDIMCSDCEVHQIEYWKPATVEELHKFHAELLEDDRHMPDSCKADYEAFSGEKWKDTPEDFAEFLEQEKAAGNIREAAA